jgi:hypothetical protein
MAGLAALGPLLARFAGQKIGYSRFPDGLYSEDGGACGAGDEGKPGIGGQAVWIFSELYL